MNRKTRGAGVMIHKLGYSGIVQFVASGLKGLGVMGLTQATVHRTSPQVNVFFDVFLITHNLSLS
jgi:hypothetical protein